MTSRMRSSLVLPFSWRDSLGAPWEGSEDPTFVCSGEKWIEERLRLDIRKDFQKVGEVPGIGEWGSDGCHRCSGLCQTEIGRCSS